VGKEESELLLVALELALAQAEPVAISVAAGAGVTAVIASELCEAAAWALGNALAEGDANAVSAEKAEVLASRVPLAKKVPLAQSEAVLVRAALREALPLAVKRAVLGAVTRALGVKARVALCIAECAALALLQADIDAAPARVKLVEMLGRAPLGVIVLEGV
jgi:hypothetical protein